MGPSCYIEYRGIRNRTIKGFYCIYRICVDIGNITLLTQWSYSFIAPIHWWFLFAFSREREELGCCTSLSIPWEHPWHHPGCSQVLQWGRGHSGELHHCYRRVHTAVWAAQECSGEDEWTAAGDGGERETAAGERQHGETQGLRGPGVVQDIWD